MYITREQNLIMKTADGQGEGQKKEEDLKSYSNEIDELLGNTYSYAYDGGK